MAHHYRSIWSWEKREDIMTFDVEWDQYPLEDYNSPHSFFDNIDRVQLLAGTKFAHEDAVEDHWMKMIDDYDI